jgi:hypothetical protein
MTLRPPVVSVVMPSLNQARYISTAARSVLAQTGPDVELLVMDGGSDDGSLSLLAGLATEYPGRVRWWSVPDGGPAEAVNAAVREAAAPVIGWLNSDDVYVPGAIARAFDHLLQRPTEVMVYGHGEHIDGRGAVLSRYPTLYPDTSLQAFADGCFICQPTAFFRRDAFLAVGGLDTTLQAAFDFDLWLRMFQAYRGRISFIDTVQAQSRLHEGSITMRFRERVALEGLRVVHRHLGAAPAHWLLTHLDELCAQHPFHAEAKDLRAEFSRLMGQARGLIASEDAEQLMHRAAADCRLQLSTPSAFVTVHPDGWAGESLEVRFQQGEHTARQIRLACVNATPSGAGLRLRIVSPDGTTRTVDVRDNGPFEIVMELPDGRPRARAVFRIESEDWFVPAEAEPGSSDSRRLAYRVEGFEAL